MKASDDSTAPAGPRRRFRRLALIASLPVAAIAIAEAALRVPLVRAILPDPVSISFTPPFSEAEMQPYIDVAKSLPTIYRAPEIDENEEPDREHLYAPTYWCDHVPCPSQQYRAVLKTKSGKTIYDVTYDIDEYGRRVVPRDPQAPPSSRFALFLGCSITFGEGVEGRQSLPAQFSRFHPEFKSYNLGVHGNSPADALDQITRVRAKRLDGISEPKGILVYTHIDAHLRILTGSMVEMRAWYTPGKPSYELVDGQAVYRGSFAEAAPWRTRALQLLGASELLKFLGVDLPLFGEPHFALYVQVMKQILASAKEHLNIERAYFVAAPGAAFNTEIVRRMREQTDWHVIDLTGVDLERLFDRDPRLPVDRHPNPNLLQVFGKVLSDKIAKDLDR